MGSMPIEFKRITCRKECFITCSAKIHLSLCPLYAKCFLNLVTSIIYVVKAKKHPANYKFNSDPSLSDNTIITLFQSRDLIPTCRHPDPTTGHHCPSPREVKTLRDESDTTEGHLTNIKNAEVFIDVLMDVFTQSSRNDWTDDDIWHWKRL